MVNAVYFWGQCNQLWNSNFGMNPSSWVMQNRKPFQLILLLLFSWLHNYDTCTSELGHWQYQLRKRWLQIQNSDCVLVFLKHPPISRLFFFFGLCCLRSRIACVLFRRALFLLCFVGFPIAHCVLQHLSSIAWCAPWPDCVLGRDHYSGSSMKILLINLKLCEVIVLIFRLLASACCWFCSSIGA